MRRMRSGNETICSLAVSHPCSIVVLSTGSGHVEEDRGGKDVANKSAHCGPRQCQHCLHYMCRNMERVMKLCGMVAISLLICSHHYVT